MKDRRECLAERKQDTQKYITDTVTFLSDILLRTNTPILLMLKMVYSWSLQPVHPKGDQSWVFFGRNDAKAETPVLWPPHAKSWLIGKDSDWGQEEKGTTEDEMAGWHHGLNGHESEWTPGDGDGQGGLACCDSWGRKESDTTERLNWTELDWIHFEFILYMLLENVLVLLHVAVQFSQHHLLKRLSLLHCIFLPPLS